MHSQTPLTTNNAMAITTTTTSTTVTNTVSSTITITIAIAHSLAHTLKTQPALVRSKIV